MLVNTEIFLDILLSTPNSKFIILPNDIDL
jgi:hypothetical protein